MAREIEENTDTEHLFKRGNVWYIRIIQNGKRLIQTTQKTVLKEARTERDRILNHATLKIAKQREENVLSRIASLDQQLAVIEDKKPATTIAAGWQAYLDQSNRPDSGESTLRQYEFQYEAFAKWFANNHPKVDKEGKPIRWELRHVTQEDVDRYASHLIKKVSPSTFNRHVVLLALVWRVLGKIARLSGNPWKQIERKRFAVHSRRELTLEELQNVCQAAQGEMRLLLALGIYGGLRLGDAACLQWSNVDLMKGIITLIPMKTARRLQKRITIPIHRTLHALLSEIPKGKRNGHVMPVIAERYHAYDGALAKDVAALFLSVNIKTGANAMTAAEKEAEKKAKAAEKKPPTVKRAAKRASADCGFHSLRHTFVSLCAAGGVSQSVVQSLVGHGSPAMTQHYTHIAIETAQNAVAALPDVTPSGTLQKPADAAQSAAGSMLAIVEGMTAETWQSDRARLLELLGDDVRRQPAIPSATTPL